MILMFVIFNIQFTTEASSNPGNVVLTIYAHAKASGPVSDTRIQRMSCNPIMCPMYQNWKKDER